MSRTGKEKGSGRYSLGSWGDLGGGCSRALVYGAGWSLGAWGRE